MHKTTSISTQVFLLTWLALGATSLHAQSLPLEQAFRHPPAEARPWVYWFWNNGNVTSNGVTADLEAMRRVGIGGVLIMDVVERFAPPRGTAEFMNPEWRGLMQFSLQEAARLGLEVNLANGPGWCGSSGVWVTPELSMQKLVWTNLVVNGPMQFDSRLPEPYTGDKVKQAKIHSDGGPKYQDFYHDIVVLAYPVPTNGSVSVQAVQNLSSRLGADGTLRWPVPAGRWAVQRIGHTTTGAATRPPVAGGTGLECDKLSREAMDAHFASMMGRLIATAGPLVGKSLTATHIDSWEVGTQNWTPKFCEEFKKRRGYDPLPFLPCILTQGKKAVAIGGREKAERFRWDFEQTISELLAENYTGRLAELAHAHKLRLSIEGYNLNHIGDEATYTARADEPMSEFWTASPQVSAATRRDKGPQMASVAHTLGRRIVGAEAFTSAADEEWRLHPALIKALGDEQFSHGINRFVFHRYAHQPYLDRVPGATMGPWGLHYERTQTWWELSGAWHDYLARCQFLLRQGLFVADLCYLRPESPFLTGFSPTPPPPDGYRYDEISAEALLARVSVKDGRLVLPDGMSYRALVLPPVQSITPTLARKLRHLLADGATLFANGPRPQASPSLAGFPKCDQEVAKLTAELWGDCDGNAVTEHVLGKGRLFWGPSPEQVLTKLGVVADFSADANLNWIHRHDGDREIYFVANPLPVSVEAKCHFRVKDRQPELWNPETAEIRPLAAYEPGPKGVSIPLHFEPSGSCFIVFGSQGKRFDPVVSFTRNGQTVFVAPKPKPEVMVIQKATYGVPDDSIRTRDVRAKLQAMVDAGRTEIDVREMALGDDPAPHVRKTLSVEYTVDGRAATCRGKDTDRLRLVLPLAAAERPAEVRRAADGTLLLEVAEPGAYEFKTASGRTLRREVTKVPVPIELSGPWQVKFRPGRGAPEQITLDTLTSWSDSTNPGVKYFSGLATYTKTFAWSRPLQETNNLKLLLDLGDVQVMARVKLNGRDLGVLWKPPFRLDVTQALCAAQNTLEISVANLWPNRLIGDAGLPQEQRLTWSSWEPFKSDMPLLPSGLLGPVRLLEMSSQRLLTSLP